MSRRSSRSGSRGDRGRRWRTYLLIVLLVASVAVVSAGLFTNTPIVQFSELDVVAGPSSLLGLEVANATCANTRDELLALRNNLGERANVTIALIESDSGQLHYESQRGTVVTFDLIAGGNETVAITAANVSTVEFVVTVQTTSETESTTRSVSVLDTARAARCESD